MGKTTEVEAGSKNGVRRMVIALVAIALEVLLIAANFTWLTDYAEWINIITRVFAFALVLVIYNQNKTAAVRLTWTILIMTLPILGVALYFLIETNYRDFENTLAQCREVTEQYKDPRAGMKLRLLAFRLIAPLL